MIEKIKEWYDSIKKYLKAVQGEVKRITWPTKKELRAATIVVIITLVVVTLYLWLADQILIKIFAKINKFL